MIGCCYGTSNDQFDIHDLEYGNKILRVAKELYFKAFMTVNKENKLLLHEFYIKWD